MATARLDAMVLRVEISPQTNQLGLPSSFSLISLMSSFMLF